MPLPSSERIILTGASAGLGRAMALLYARRGAAMVLTARRGDLLDTLAAEVRSLGGRAVTVQGDVTDPALPARLVETALREFGGWDTVILNAGVSEPLWAREFDLERVERAIEVNYLSIARAIGALLPGMLREGRGKIVAVSSLAGYRGMPGSGAYNASKAAVTTLMESLRAETRGSGVEMITIAPGFVRTAMTDKNEFSMPFLMEPEEAARRMVDAIDRGRSEYRFPIGTSLAVRFLQILPNAIYDRLVSWGRTRGARMKTAAEGRGKD